MKPVYTLNLWFSDGRFWCSEYFSSLKRVNRVAEIWFNGGFIVSIEKD